MRQNYKIEKLEIDGLDPRTGCWSAYGGPAVKGIQYLYEVKDGNYRSLNRWTIAVRVPNAKNKNIFVQPILTPGKKIWAGLDFKPIQFVRAKKHPYRGQVYCKLNLAFGSTKKGVNRGERGELPKWFEFLKRTMRLKDTVNTTRAHDQKVQVAMVHPGDHDKMIAIYFALKVWVMAEGFTLAD